MREVRDLTLAEDGDERIRVVLSDETWVQTQRIGGRTVKTAMRSHWRWTASPELDPYPQRAIWRFCDCHPPGRRVCRSLQSRKPRIHSHG